MAEEVSVKYVFEKVKNLSGSQEEFLSNLLLLQKSISKAKQGIIFQVDKSGQIQISNSDPVINPQELPPWINDISQRISDVVNKNKSSLSTISNEVGKVDFVFLMPVKQENNIYVEAFVLKQLAQKEIITITEKLELTTSLFSLYQQRTKLLEKNTSILRIKKCLDIILTVNTYQKAFKYALSLCNNFASSWKCTRVSIAFVVRGYARLYATSHTATYTRGSVFIRELEAAMEESIFQDTEIIYPQSSSATYIHRSTKIFSENHDNHILLHIPIRYMNKICGVISLEREKENNNFSDEEIEDLRLCTDLVTPRLIDLYENRNIFLTLFDKLVKTPLKFILGHEHTWAKIAAIVVATLFLVMSTVKKDHIIDSSVNITTLEEQSIVSAIESKIVDILAKPSEIVKKGQLLGRLDSEEIEKLLAENRYRKESFEKESNKAYSNQEIADYTIYNTRVKETKIRIELLEKQMQACKLIAPIDGVIISEDISTQRNKPVSQGDLLFTIGKLDKLQGEIFIPEEELPYVKKGQKGIFILLSRPNQEMNFTIRYINPVAEIREEKNVFKAFIDIDYQDENKDLKWIRPNMEGIAKVNTGEKLLGFVVFKKLIHWFKIKLW